MKVLFQIVDCVAKSNFVEGCLESIAVRFVVCLAVSYLETLCLPI